MLYATHSKTFSLARTAFCMAFQFSSNQFWFPIGFRSYYSSFYFSDIYKNIFINL